MAAGSIISFAQCCKANAGSNKTYCCACVTIGGSPAAIDTFAGCDSVLYRWTPTTGLNNANIANPCASPNQTTTYTLTIYAVNHITMDTCCTSKSTVKVTKTANCCRMAGQHQESSAEAHFSIYPNPTSSVLNVEIGQSLQSGQIEVYDINGKLILQRSGITEGIQSIDISGNPKGVYFVKVKDGYSQVFSKKIILE